MDVVVVGTYHVYTGVVSSRILAITPSCYSTFKFMNETTYLRAAVS
jgi:hypothetical protein